MKLSFNNQPTFHHWVLNVLPMEILRIVKSRILTNAFRNLSFEIRIPISGFRMASLGFLNTSFGYRVLGLILIAKFGIPGLLTEVEILQVSTS